MLTKVLSPKSLWFASVALLAGGLTWAACPAIVQGSQAEPYCNHGCLDGEGCGGYCCCIVICASGGCPSYTQSQSCLSPAICEWAADVYCRGDGC